MDYTRAQLEEMYLLQTTLAQRQATDPLLTWKPHVKQAEFIAAVLGDESYENWALWANRAGKSDAGAYCGSHAARFGIEAQRPAIGTSTVVWDRSTAGWVVSLDTPASRDVIQPKYFDNGFVPGSSTHAPFIPDREIAEWRQGDQVLKLKNGSIIGFKSCESGRKKFQGVERDWVHFDEEPPQDIYTESTIRIGAGKRLRIFGTCTLLPPEGVLGGVTWVYTQIAKPVLDGKKTTARIFQASIYDNPHLPREDIALLEAKYPEGSIERRIRLDGELLPGLSGSRAYGAFFYGVHVRDLPPLEPRRPLCWMLDFNVEPMVSLVGQRVRGIFRVHQELIIEQGSVSEMGRMFRDAHPSHRAEIWIYGDSTGKFRDAQTSKTDYQLLLAELRGYPVPLKMRVPDANPHVPDRVNAVNRALRDEYGENRVEIDPSCEELIADLEGVLRDPKGGIKKTYNPKDPYVRRTHTSDAFGYWVAREEPVTSQAIRNRTEYGSTQRFTSIRQPTYGGSSEPTGQPEVQGVFQRPTRTF